MKGGRGMSYRICDAMRTEHPTSPLHKGERGSVVKTRPLSLLYSYAGGTPKVVAIAVNTVMTMFRIFPKRFLFIVMSYKL